MESFRIFSLIHLTTPKVWNCRSQSSLVDSELVLILTAAPAVPDGAAEIIVTVFASSIY